MHATDWLVISVTRLGCVLQEKVKMPFWKLQWGKWIHNSSKYTIDSTSSFVVAFMLHTNDIMGRCYNDPLGGNGKWWKLSHIK